MIFVSIIYKLDTRIDPVKGERIKAPSNSYFCLIGMFQKVLLYPLPLKQPQAPTALESLILFISESLGCRFFFFFYSVPVVFGLEAYRRQLVSWCLIFLSCFICLSDGASVLGSLGVHGDRSLRQIGLSDLGGAPRDP